MLPASVRAYFKARLDAPAPSPVAPLPSEYAAYRAAMDKAKLTDWPDLCHYRAYNARLVAGPASPRRIVYMGDSLTELWGVADPAFFSDDRVNRGISGQTTAQMLVRFQADVIALHPRVVHLLAGSNDVAGNTGPQTMQDVRNNIVAMVTLARANGIRVVLASLFPAAKFPWSPTLEPEPQIRAINTWLRSYATQVGATYVDYHALLTTADGGLQPAQTIDGVHVNSTGYRLIEPLSRSTTDALAAKGTRP